MAIGRDKQGMARIRVSLEARLRCGDEVVPLIRYFPPPQIGKAWLPPGRVVPVERTRRVRFDLVMPGRRAERRRWDAVGGRDQRARDGGQQHADQVHVPPVIRQPSLESAPSTDDGFELRSGRPRADHCR